MSIYHLIAYLSLFCVCISSNRDCKGQLCFRHEIGIEEIPFIVYLEFNNLHFTSESPAHAAGTVIDINMVLTRAYHCEVSPSASFRLYPGQTYVRPKLHEKPISQYVVHPARKRLTYDESQSVHRYEMLYTMDFCLLRLPIVVDPSPNIQLAPLPMPDEELHPGHRMLVSGWGPYHDKDYIQGSSLIGRDGVADYTKASLFHHRPPVENYTICRDVLKSVGIEMDRSMFCLGFRCRDCHTALGDDGGPILDPVIEKVVGMVVNVRLLDRGDFPQLNIMTSYAVDWINDVRGRWS